MNLEREAIKVSHDLGEVVFVGAFAVVAHVGSYRQTRDLDLAIAAPISEQKLESLGYLTRVEGGNRITRTPNGVKLDIYAEDVGGIVISEIFRTAKVTRVGKEKIKVMGLEALLLAKLRASRPQDVDDIRQLVRTHSRDIDWNVLGSLTTSSVEIENLRNIVRALSGR
jgi:predicted nucleotidyltransferase